MYWPDGDQPTDGYARCRGNRSFGTLRAALNFVLIELTESERGTAYVSFALPPYSLDFNDPKTGRKAQEILKG